MMRPRHIQYSSPSLWTNGSRDKASDAVGRRLSVRVTATALVVAAAILICGCGIEGISARGNSSSPSMNHAVVLVPELNAGWAGWCFFVVGVSGAGGCAGVQHHPPVIAETWSSGDDPPETVGVAVTTSQVARVEINGGMSVPTQAEASLPSYLRAVVIRVGARLRSVGGGFPRMMPLDSNGALLRPSSDEPADQLLQAIPSRRVAEPDHPEGGACGLTLRGPQRQRGVVAKGGSVVTEVPHYSGIIGDGFITCASTSYEVSGWPVLASVLISASQPGARPPALPAIQPLPGHPGVFSLPELAEPGVEPSYARRVAGAWLVVSRAQSAERLTLLRDLSVSVDL